ncbi:histidine phosphatase family protein [Haliangium sp.]|uniref:histidine phosphatase family protein n=1 Tax=Haliangium sp. TaxID=2663208 RepID=UPI003D13E9D5
MFLIHHGVTDWHRDGKLLGRRDVPMNDAGRAQADRIANWLDGVGIAEVIASPLQRAVQTAEIIGKHVGIDLARDHRLIDLHLGQWEGKNPQEVLESDAYQQFLANPMSSSAPAGESFHEVKTRAVAAVEQALEDNPAGSAVAVVTHSRVIRVLLTHYMAAPPATYHCLRIHPGTVSVLAFSHDSQRPRVLALNWAASLSELLGRTEQPV